MSEKAFENWWRLLKPAECDEVEEHFIECWQAATLAERERCAKVCAEVAADYAKQARGGDMSGKSDAMQQGAEECESAIRALPEDTK